MGFTSFLFGSSKSDEMTSDSQAGLSTRSYSQAAVSRIDALEGGRADDRGQAALAAQKLVQNNSRSVADSLVEQKHSIDKNKLNDQLEHVHEQNMQLRASAEDRDAQIAKLNRELRDEKSRSRKQAQQIQPANAQVRTQETELHNQGQQIDTLSRNLYNAQVTNNANFQTLNLLQQLVSDEQKRADVAIEESKVLRENLEECKAQIFEMQPIEGFSDIQLVQATKDLCGYIETWVFTTFPDAENALAYLLSRDSTAGARDLVGSCMSRQEVQLTVMYPNLDLNLVAVFVLRHLHEVFLASKRVLPGLDSTTETTLHATVEGLKRVEPPRDNAYIQMWRVDLYRTLQTIPSLVTLRRECMRTCVNELLACFQQLLPERSFEADDIKAVQSMVKDAWALAKNIRSSTGQYVWKGDIKAADPPEARVMRYEDLKKFDVVEATTGQPLRTSSIKVMNPGARIGEKLCTARPGMVRKNLANGNDLMLLKPTIIVKIDPDARQKKVLKKMNPSKGMDGKDVSDETAGDELSNGVTIASGALL